MSQSATLYRVSRDIYIKLEKSNLKQQFQISSAKNYKTFQGSFMGLEYILSKGQETSKVELINKIFNPKLYLGKQDFDKLSLKEQSEFYENYIFIPYLDTSTISKLNDFLDKISEEDIHTKYDANELNENGIYPEVWQYNNSPDQPFTKGQILKDFTELKQIIKQADNENDYIFVFIG